MHTKRKSDKRYKVQQEKSQLDKSKKSLQNSMSGWNTLLGEAVEIPSFEIFKTALHKAT